jgi:hypothetical protein
VSLKGLVKVPSNQIELTADHAKTVLETNGLYRDAVRFTNPGGHNLPPAQCLVLLLRGRFSTKQVIKLTQNCDFYDFPMPVYARQNICIKNLGNFDYTDTHFT